MSETSQDNAPVAEHLMMLGRVAQGLENAKSNSLREGWCDWAIETVHHSGRLIHLYDSERAGLAELEAAALQMHFLFAVAAACAEHETGDLIHDNAELMTAANVEANEVERMRAALRRIREHPLTTFADAVEVRGLADVALGEEAGDA